MVEHQRLDLLEQRLRRRQRVRGGTGRDGLRCCRVGQRPTSLGALDLREGQAAQHGPEVAMRRVHGRLELSAHHREGPVGRRRRGKGSLDVLEHGLEVRLRGGDKGRDACRERPHGALERELAEDGADDLDGVHEREGECLGGGEGGLHVVPQ